MPAQHRGRKIFTLQTRGYGPMNLKTLNPIEQQGLPAGPGRIAYLVQEWLSCPEQPHPQQAPLASLQQHCWLRSSSMALSSAWRDDALTCPMHWLMRSGTCTRLMCRRAQPTACSVILSAFSLKGETCCLHACLPAALPTYLMLVAGE